MTKLDKIEAQARAAPQSISFDDPIALAESYFGEPRHGSGSRVVFKTPWQGDPPHQSAEQERSSQARSGAAAHQGDRRVEGEL